MMNRRGFLGGFAAAGFGGITLFALQPTADRIDDLEATVETLDERVSALEDDSGASSPDDVEATRPSGSEDSDWVTSEGVGLTATDKFELNAGRFRVHATVDAQSEFSGFIAHIYDPSGGEANLFNELIQNGPLNWEGETIYTAPSTGDYFIEVSNTDFAWSLAFEPFKSGEISTPSLYSG